MKRQTQAQIRARLFQVIRDTDSRMTLRDRLSRASKYPTLPNQAH